MASAPHHDTEAGLSITHWDDGHESHPRYATLVEYPDHLVLVTSDGPKEYTSPPEPYEGQVEHLYAFLYSHTGSSHLADKIMSHLYAGHPPSRHLPPGTQHRVHFQGYYDFVVQCEGDGHDHALLANRIVEGIVGEFDAAADVWLDRTDDDDWPEFMVHSITCQAATVAPF